MVWELKMKSKRTLFVIVTVILGGIACSIVAVRQGYKLPSPNFGSLPGGEISAPSLPSSR